MASQSGRTDPSLAEILFEEGFRFEFFQAVRVLERLYNGREPVGGEAPLEKETVRFRSRISLTFPPSAIYEINEPAADGEQPEMTVAFMGLAGLLGVLPRHYTEMILERTRHRDTTLRDFLDLFNHRMISFFYRAWEKYRFPVAYERAVKTRERYDPVSLYLFDLVGMGTQGLRQRLQVEGESLLFYAGLFAQQPRSASALEAVLADYFEVPVSSEQFIGQWLPLSKEQRACLGSAKSKTSLGGAILGARFWDQQAKFSLRVGPMGFKQLQRFFPTERTFKKLVQLARLHVGQALEFDLRLVLKAAEVPACRLGRPGPDALRLGWSSWLKSREFQYDADDAVIGSHWTRVGERQ